MTMLPTLIALAGLAILIGASLAALGVRPIPQPVPVRVRRRR